MKKLILALTIIFAFSFYQGSQIIKKVYSNNKKLSHETFEKEKDEHGEIIIDSSFSLSPHIKREQFHWQLFLDSNSTYPIEEFYTFNDTSFHLKYHKNGQLKLLDKSFNHIWIHTTKWCKNGQVIFSANPNKEGYHKETGYHCNGTKAWESNINGDQFWGKELRWWSNGKLKLERINTTYKKEFDTIQHPTSNVISERHWDYNGTEIKK